jgi:hypothetical protein
MSPSQCSTSFAYEDDPSVLANENIDSLYDEWLSFYDKNSGSSESIDIETSSSSDSDSGREIIDDNVIDINNVKYPSPSLFLPKEYFTFNKYYYELMLADIQGLKNISVDMLSYARNGITIDIRMWRKMKQRILLGEDNVMYLKFSSNLKIPYEEQWEEIVPNAHVKSCHLGLKDTLLQIQKSWSIDMRCHGISKLYVKACIDACGCQKVKKLLLSKCLAKNLESMNKLTIFRTKSWW